MNDFVNKAILYCFQLMVAFEGHHVTNLGQNVNNVEQFAGGASVEAVRKMVKDSKKKLNELQKTVKSVDYSSSRCVCYSSVVTNDK